MWLLFKIIVHNLIFSFCLSLLQMASFEQLFRCDHLFSVLYVWFGDVPSSISIKSSSTSFGALNEGFTFIFLIIFLWSVISNFLGCFFSGIDSIRSSYLNLLIIPPTVLLLKLSMAAICLYDFLLALWKITSWRILKLVLFSPVIMICEFHEYRNATDATRLDMVFICRLACL